MSNNFTTQPGGFYVSDDDATLVHQYWTKTPPEPIVSSDSSLSLTPGYPVAVSDSDKIGSGTVLTVKRAFLRIVHLALNSGKGTDLFLNKLQFTLSDTVNTCPDMGTVDKKFEINVQDNAGNQVNDNLWILYTQAAQNESTPSLSTKIKNKPDLSNTGYDATGTRSTLYLMDTDNNICYQAQLNDGGLNSFEFGIHTGETPNT